MRGGSVGVSEISDMVTVDGGYAKGVLRSVERTVMGEERGWREKADTMLNIIN